MIDQTTLGWMLVGTGVLVYIGPKIFDRFIVPQTSYGFQSRYREKQYTARREADGLSPEEIDIERHILRSQAHIQHEASEAVWRNDGDIDEQIRTIAAAEIQIKTGISDFVGRKLYRILQETRSHELLYPQALEELERQYKAGERERPEDWSPPRRAKGHALSKDQQERLDFIELSAFVTRKES